MRILHSISSVNPAGGGPIEGLKQLAAVNTSHGHEVEVVCLDAPDAPWLREFPLRCHALGPALLRYDYSSRLAPWLRANRERYDAVVVNGLWQYPSFAVWRALRDSPTPYFVFTHGMLDPWFKHAYPLKHIKKWLYWPWAEYRVLRDAAAVLFTCEEERRLARQSFWLYQCNEVVVEYGTRAPTGNAGYQRGLFLDRFPQLRDKRCLLFLGRVHEKKGADLLFRAFADLLEGLPPREADRLHLVMAGPDDHAYGREMHALAHSLGLEPRMTWTGMVRGDLKWGAFHVADAFVLTSHQENFGIAVVEALACGVPVLITNRVNIWREIEAAGAGFVDDDDVAGARRLLERWIHVPEGEWRNMRREAARLFSERYVVERAADSLIHALLARDAHAATTA